MKIASSYRPQSHQSSLLGVTPFEFRDNPGICKKTRMFALSFGEKKHYVDFVRFDAIPECDRRADGHLCCANTSACTACYATTLVKNGQKLMNFYDVTKLDGLFFCADHPACFTSPRYSYILSHMKAAVKWRNFVLHRCYVIITA